MGYLDRTKKEVVKEVLTEEDEILLAEKGAKFKFIADLKKKSKKKPMAKEESKEKDKSFMKKGGKPKKCACGCQNEMKKKFEKGGLINICTCCGAKH